MWLEILLQHFLACIFECRGSTNQKIKGSAKRAQEAQGFDRLWSIAHSLFFEKVKLFQKRKTPAVRNDRGSLAWRVSEYLLTLKKLNTRLDSIVESKAHSFANLSFA